MINVNVSISGIIMCCDESLCGLNLGRGYTIEKCNLDTLFFKDKIMILSILVDTFISKISFPMQPGPEIGSISDA